MSTLHEPAELEAAIRAVGAERYHDKHPFHRLLHGGKLNKGQVQAWALNRYCYQSAVPRKDAALISRVHDRELRREWVHRILDHDGAGRRGRRHRALAGADRCAGPRPRLCRLHAGRAAGDALRGRGLRHLRARPHAAGGGGLLADRAVRARHPSRAHLRHAGELRLHRRAGHAVFPPPPRPGRPRLPTSPSTTSSATRPQRRCRPPPSTPCASSATCCGPSSTRCITPTSRRV